MPAGGFKTFTSGEILTAADVNSFLMQGVLVFDDATARGSAITSPVEGQFSFRKDEDAFEVYDGSEWVGVGGGLPFATVSATTGSPATSTMTDANGFEWTYYDFTGNGSITLDSAGYLDVLVVGGGGAGAAQGTSGNRARSGGGAGAVRWGLHYATATTHTVTVGAGGSGGVTVNNYAISNPGSESAVGTVLLAGGGGKALARNNGGTLNAGVDQWGGGGSGGGMSQDDTGSLRRATGGGAGGSVYATNLYDGISLNYNGSTIEFGKGGVASDPTANTGGGGNSETVTYGTGATGRVIVRVLV